MRAMRRAHPRMAIDEVQVGAVEAAPPGKVEHSPCLLRIQRSSCAQANQTHTQAVDDDKTFILHQVLQ